VDKGGTEKADKGGCFVVKLVTLNVHKKGEFKVNSGEQNVPAFATFVRLRKGENLHLGAAYRPASAQGSALKSVRVAWCGGVVVFEGSDDGVENEAPFKGPSALKGL
jgi:hypothetical protein